MIGQTAWGGRAHGHSYTISCLPKSVTGPFGIGWMTTRMKKDRVLAWIHGFEAAREAERDLARNEPVDSAGSVAIALSLTEFARRCGGEGFGRDQARDDDVRIVRERWAKLRRAYRL